MKKNEMKYPGCWACENIVDENGALGLLYLGFPRCFILIRDYDDFYMKNFQSFKEGVAEINWLDPKDEPTEREKEEVLRMLWNFCIDQEEEEENLFERNRDAYRHLADEED